MGWADFINPLISNVLRKWAIELCNFKCFSHEIYMFIHSKGITVISDFLRIAATSHRPLYFYCQQCTMEVLIGQLVDFLTAPSNSRPLGWDSVGPLEQLCLRTYVHHPLETASLRITIPEIHRQLRGVTDDYDSKEASHTHNFRLASDSLGGSTSTGLRSEAVRNADIEDYVAGAAVLQVLR